MIVMVTGLFFASVLFWFGLIKSDWIAPAALFGASAPVVAAFSWNYDAVRIAIHLLMTLLIFYAAFGCGRWASDSRADTR